MKTPSSSQFAVIGALLVLLLVTIRVGYFYFATDEVLIGVIADDAFYYMEMARHRAEDGFWTFDGTSPATGFHFLYGYFLVSIYKILGDLSWRDLYLLVGILSSVFISVSAYLVSISAARSFGRESTLLAVTPFLTFPSLMLGTAMMESWLVLFFSAATIYGLTVDRNPSRLGGTVLLVIGMLGSMSRTDYGMLPGVAFSVLLLSYPVFKGPALKRSLLILVGAILGLAVVLGQNLWISGQLSQASAQTKFFWSSVVGHNASPAISLVDAIVIPFASSVNDEIELAVLMAALFSLAYFYYSFRIRRPREPEQFFPPFLMVSICLVVVLGYIAFYRHNSQALQTWYAANFIGPIGIIMSGIAFMTLTKRLGLVALLGLCVYGVAGASKVLYAPWPHQAGMMRAGLFLRDYDPGATYGAWNAGTIGYFSRVGVVNIDGLTNDEVVPFVKDNALFDYISKRGIDYLVDYPVMLNDPNRRARGGYQDARVDRCLRPVEVIDGDSPRFAGSELTIFEVKRDCS